MLHKLTTGQEKRNVNMNVNVTYQLSAAGQRAALIAGRCASKTVTESMELTDLALLDDLNIAADGSLSFDATKRHIPADSYIFSTMEMDAPPATLAEVLAAYAAYRAAINTGYELRAAKAAAVRADEQKRADEKAAHDAPLVDAILASLEALDPLADFPSGISAYSYSPTRASVTDHGADLNVNAEQGARLRAILAAREQAAEAAKAAKVAQRDAERAAEIAQYGGYRWVPEGGMVDFQGRGLWASGQSKRWVGIFTAPKGIAKFLDSPRGEHTFSVGCLQPGDCIQGGGYDTNSRGKRRNETEFFGVVVANSADGLVVNICGSRSAAFAAAKL